MKANSNKNNRKFLSEILIHIVGPNNLQNELLAWHLEQETALLCSWGKELDFIPSLQEGDPAINHLILWDCHDLGKDEIFRELKPGGKLYLPQCFIALINLHPALAREKQIMHLGVRGVFCNDAPLKLLSKCVLAILSDELWFPRDMLERNAFQPKNSSHFKNNETNLTTRELEILRCISIGETTKQIANRFSISPHTVKTHTYNIFKKIDVSSRLHATLWATRNLI